MNISRRSVLLAAGACCLPSITEASPLPDRTIKIVVPVSPGGIVDFLGRATAQFLAKDLKKTFIIENRAGAGMGIGATAVARSTPDGTTFIMMSSSPLVLNPHIYKNLQYDPQSDFRLLSIVADSPFILLVKKSSPATTVAELVSFAKSGKTLTFGSAGVGSITHVTAEMLKVHAKIDSTHVPFSGSNPALTALLGEQIDFYFGETSTFLPYVKNGDLRALAVTSSDRLELLPDIPTMIESGYPNFISGSWFVIAAPSRISPDIALALKSSADRAIVDPEFRALLLKSGLLPQQPRSYEEIDQMRKDGVERWRPIIAAQKIAIE
jgi:tripartite-type tricarboxylate transporter receptor subunit TctC